MNTEKPMVSTLYCCVAIGLEPQLVQVETDLSAQLPTLKLIGLPSAMTQESGERVRSAIVNAGFDWPARKITINLLPAALPKWGSHFELPMALGILVAQSENAALLAQPIFALGELSLSGEIRSSGWLRAVRSWLKRALVSVQQAHPAKAAPIVVCHPAEQLGELGTIERIESETLKGGYEGLLRRLQIRNEVALLNKAGTPPTSQPSVLTPSFVPAPTAASSYELLAEVEGEPLGVLAGLLATLNSFHLLLVGPQGMGKSMLARAVCRGAIPLSADEKDERDGLFATLCAEGLSAELMGGVDGGSGAGVGASAGAGAAVGEGSAVGTGVVAGLAAVEAVSSRRGDCPRPVVSLQTSISRAALEGALGASGQVVAGALTRAHHGIIVADEFLELRRDVLEALRLPLEERVVRLQRARFHTKLPAAFQLLATTNLCPCGYFGHARRTCRCPLMSQERYQNKLSGPILDRFDLIVILGQAPGRSVGREGQASPAGWDTELSREARALLDRFIAPKRWPALRARAAEHAGRLAQAPAPSAESVVRAPQTFSDERFSRRATQRVTRVARWLAALDENHDARASVAPYHPAHWELACALRQDVDQFFRRLRGGRG